MVLPVNTDTPNVISLITTVELKRANVSPCLNVFQRVSPCLNVFSAFPFSKRGKSSPILVGEEGEVQTALPRFFFLFQKNRKEPFTIIISPRVFSGRGDSRGDCPYKNGTGLSLNQTLLRKTKYHRPHSSTLNVRDGPNGAMDCALPAYVCR